MSSGISGIPLLERVQTLELQREQLLAQLKVILDQVDYTAGNCKPNDMVGAILPVLVIKNARTTIASVERE